MLTADAIPILEHACRKPFKELFKGHPTDLRTNKGHAGQLLERHIGLTLGSHLIDFDDGELKTNKTAPSGKPLETIAITQISTTIDQMICDPALSFEESRVYKKLDNLIVVPVVKEGPCEEWYLLAVYHIDLNARDALRARFADDYAKICREVRRKAITDGRIGTTNGTYLQIRTKDSRPYHPIYSYILDKYVSNKNYAFYLQKAFMLDVVSGKIC